MAQRERPEERDVVGDELATGRGLLEQPPGVPGPQRQDVEDLVLVVAEVGEVAGRAAGRDERQPQDDEGREADRAGPPARRPRRGPRRRRSRSPRTTPRTARGTGWPAAWCISDTAMSTAASPFRPRVAAIAAPSAGQHEDRLVLAPPAPTRTARPGTSRTAARARGPPSAVDRAGRTTTSAASPRSASDAGTFISARIAGSDGVGDGREGRLDRGQDRPDVGHHRPERDRPRVGVAVERRQAVRSRCGGPSRRTGRCRRGRPVVGSRTSADDDPDDEDRDRGPRQSARRQARARGDSDAAGHPVALGRRRRPRRARPSSGRTPGPRWPSPSSSSNSRSIWLS